MILREKKERMLSDLCSCPYLACKPLPDPLLWPHLLQSSAAEAAQRRKAKDMSLREKKERMLARNATHGHSNSQPQGQQTGDAQGQSDQGRIMRRTTDGRCGVGGDGCGEGGRAGGRWMVGVKSRG